MCTPLLTFKVRIEKYCHWKPQSRIVLIRMHASSLVIINKSLLFLGVQSATPPKTPQETKDNVSTLYTANGIERIMHIMYVAFSIFSFILFFFIRLIWPSSDRKILRGQNYNNFLYFIEIVEVKSIEK